MSKRYYKGIKALNISKESIFLVTGDINGRICKAVEKTRNSQSLSKIIKKQVCRNAMLNLFLTHFKDMYMLSTSAFLKVFQRTSVSHA